MHEVEKPGLVRQVEKELGSLKWHLWNGNVVPALRIVDGLQILSDGDELSVGAEEATQDRPRIRCVHRAQPAIHSGLRGPVSQRGNDHDRLCGIGGEPSGEQTVRQETTDEMEPT